MGTMLRTTGRTLLRHGPALAAWFLAGTLVHYVITEIAGFVGAFSATAALMILPLAILARLISLVAMFLVLRDGLRELQGIAPLPDAPAERRRTFFAALLASILPFFTVYAAQGLLREDVIGYSRRALEVQQTLLWEKAAQDIAAGGSPGVVAEAPDTVLDVPLSAWTAAAIVLALLGRWAWARWSASLPRPLALLAVYLEVVWVFLSLLVVQELVGSVTGWIDRRAALHWLEELAAMLSAHLPPLGWVLDGGRWLLDAAGPVLLVPVVWLTVAGVVYGQAIVAEKLSLQERFSAGLTRRAGEHVAQRLHDLGGQLGERFRPIGRALLLMWRAGVVLIAGYAVLYALVLLVESWLRLGVTRVLGPHELGGFWVVFDEPLSLVTPLLVEPLRIALVAAAYDATLGRLRRAQAAIPQDRAQADAGALAQAAGVEIPAAEQGVPVAGPVAPGPLMPRPGSAP
ncbi:hypothetical protein [Brachybacterium hainanense]|uniref:Uncharacterized protein n=1 Tax=Brachybacterium hainanense TaxID=1541174 RepID=A0ABV6R7U5_9MICO